MKADEALLVCSTRKPRGTRSTRPEARAKSKETIMKLEETTDLRFGRQQAKRQPGPQEVPDLL